MELDDELVHISKQLAQQRDLIAVLAGRFPSQQPGEAFTLAALQLPADLPVSLPSRIVEHRFEASVRHRIEPASRNVEAEQRLRRHHD